MSHNRDHIIIHSLRQPTSFDLSEGRNLPAPSKLEFWHIPAITLVIGLILGALF